MPSDIRLNGASHPLETPVTVAVLLQTLALRPGPVAVELNGQVVPKARHGEQLVQPGDVVEVVAFVGGG